jgi:hypothetical protein
VVFLRDMMFLSLREVRRRSAMADWQLDHFAIPVNARRYSLEDNWNSMLELMPHWMEDLTDHAETFARPLRRLPGCVVSFFEGECF